ncbi:MAG: hypothetical protein ACRD1Z_08575 [Vicinamibacteria bacterium]
MARKRIGQITPDDVSAAAARALRACKGLPEECIPACREGVLATEREMKAVLRERGVRLRGVRIVREK